MKNDPIRISYVDTKADSERARAEFEEQGIDHQYAYAAALGYVRGWADREKEGGGDECHGERAHLLRPGHEGRHG